MRARMRHEAAQTGAYFGSFYSELKNDFAGFSFRLWLFPD
jgi:hypothetical protein